MCSCALNPGAWAGSKVIALAPGVFGIAGRGPVQGTERAGPARFCSSAARGAQSHTGLGKVLPEGDQRPHSHPDDQDVTWHSAALVQAGCVPVINSSAIPHPSSGLRRGERTMQAEHTERLRKRR